MAIAQVCTNGSVWCWSADSDIGTPNPRRLNWLGVFREEGDLEISVEVNTPFERRNNQIAGFFARDCSSGSIYLVHSGRVGGGRRGVSKDAFLAWVNRPLVEVVDSNGGIRIGLLVMPVRGAAATWPAVRYVETVAEFKQAIRTGTVNSPDFVSKLTRYKNYYSEGRGRRRGVRSTRIDYVTRHGEVVDALQQWRLRRPLPRNPRIVKDVFMDLGVESSGVLVEVYEAKTSASRGDIYTGVGQLMVHGASPQCERTLVLPSGDALSKELASALRRLGIQLLKCSLDENSATIV